MLPSKAATPALRVDGGTRRAQVRGRRCGAARAGKHILHREIDCRTGTDSFTDIEVKGHQARDATVMHAGVELIVGDVAKRESTKRRERTVLRVHANGGLLRWTIQGSGLKWITRFLNNRVEFEHAHGARQIDVVRNREPRASVDARQCGLAKVVVREGNLLATGRIGVLRVGFGVIRERSSKGIGHDNERADKRRVPRDVAGNVNVQAVFDYGLVADFERVVQFWYNGIERARHVACRVLNGGAVLIAENTHAGAEITEEEIRRENGWRFECAIKGETKGRIFVGRNEQRGLGTELWSIKFRIVIACAEHQLGLFIDFRFGLRVHTHLLENDVLFGERVR